MLQSRQSLLGAPAYQVGLCPQGLQDARSLVTSSMQGAWALDWPPGVGSPGQLGPAALLSNLSSALPFQSGLQIAAHMPPQGLDGELEHDLAPVPLAPLGIFLLPRAGGSPQQRGENLPESGSDFPQSLQGGAAATGGCVVPPSHSSPPVPAWLPVP